MSLLNTFDFTIIGFYLVAVLGIGIWAGRRVKSFEEFAVAGRSYSAFVVFATLSASFIGGGFTMGNSEKVFIIGIVNVLALWGFSLKEILVAKFIAPRIGAFPDAISVGDVMERDFGRTGKIITGIFAVLLCAGILGAQIGGMGYMFNLFLGFPIWAGVLMGMGIIIIYDTIGGMRAIVATDVLQFLMLGIGIPLCLFMGIRAVGGVNAMRAAISPEHFELFRSVTPLQFLSLFLTFLFGETLVPPYVRRLFISRDVSRIERGTIWSGIFSVPFFAVTGGIGLVALAMDPDLDPNLSMPYVIQSALPVGLRSLVIASLISVVMSSADSFLNSASISLVNDIINPLRRVPLASHRGLRWARMTTLVTGSVAVVFALKIQSLLDILIYAYNFWAPIILVPLAAVLLGFRTSKAAFIAGAISGILGVVLWNRVLGAPGRFDGMLIGLFTNLLVFTTVSLIRART